jgi:hypothetical protein
MDIDANQENNNIKLDIVVDGINIFSTTACKETKTINYKIDDAQANHAIQLVLSGKTRHHTKIDAHGKIESDIFFNLTRIEFDEINVSEIFCLGKECYTHSFNNPNIETFVDEFYGMIGCNGTVNIQFETPIYLWLSQHFN